MSTPSLGQPNPYAPPKAAVRDIVEADSGELADRGARLVACIVDALVIVFAIGLPVGISVGFAAAAHGINRGAPSFIARDLFGIGGFISLIALIVWIVVTMRFVHENGQTIGKRIMAIKVVRKDGSRASLARIFWLRNVVNGLPGFIPLINYVYLLVDHLMIFGESRQCLHDRIADTIVVKA